MTSTTTTAQLQSSDDIILALRYLNFENKAWITFDATIFDLSGTVITEYSNLFLNQTWNPDLSVLKPGTEYRFHLYAHSGGGEQTWDRYFVYQDPDNLLPLAVTFRADGIVGNWHVTIYVNPI